MSDRNNTTPYVHPQETNLLNLHRAMEYNAVGQPMVRVNAVFGGGNEYNSSTATDAFGRLRTSQPFSLFDSTFRYSDNTQKWNYLTTGNATVAHNANTASMELSVTTTTNDSVIRETNHVFKYQPGKSLLILNSFAMSTPKIYLRQRVGYFGANDGVYFMTDNDLKYFVIRSSTTGSVDDVTQKVAQSQWNVDTFDGSGDAGNPSGILLDVTKTQIFWSDIEWLGVGSVRCGFVVNGVFFVCHVFHHANIYSSVYMRTSTLPVRFEITNTGNTTGNSTLHQICSTVISEGGYTNRSISRSASSNISGSPVSSTTFTPLISIRLASDKLDAVVVPREFSIYGLSQAAYKWAVILNGTLGNANFVAEGGISSVEVDTTANTIANGTVIAEGIFVGSNKGGASIVQFDAEDFTLQLGRSLAGNSDVITFAAFATTNNDLAIGAINWQEHTS